MPKRDRRRSDRESGQARIRVVPLPHLPSQSSRCACCGLLYPLRRSVLRLYVGRRYGGDLCPDCLLRGPAGAARALRERLRGEEEGMRAPEGDRSRAEWGYRERMEKKARALESSDPFPLAARQAAVRELRERR